MEHDTKPKQQPKVPKLALLRLTEELLSPRAGERVLLHSLVLHSHTKQNYVCWPMYGMLRDWTKLSDNTLRHAAASLEEKGLITRVARRNHPNLFYVNVENILIEVSAIRKIDVDKLLQLVVKEDDNAFAGEFEESPYYEDPDGTDDLEIEPEEVGDGQVTIAYLVDGIQERWGGHPNFTQYRKYRRFLAKDLHQCVKIAGNIRLVQDVLYHVCMLDPVNMKNIAESDYLGSYILGTFPRWLKQYEEMMESQGQQS